MPSADDVRDAQRETWAGLSTGWEKWDTVIMDQLRPIGAAMIITTSTSRRAPASPA